MALPFLPGLYVDRSVCKKDFKKPHVFSKTDDVVTEVDLCPEPPFTLIPGNVSAFVKTLPRWVAFDKQVLSFEAFFQESVTEHCEGSYRIRKVKIYFFLEDDTLMVVEPRIRNTGLNQGVLVKRHRAHRPPPCNHLFYTAEDFNLGNEVEIYGRVYKICNCDNFTACFYKHIGIILRPPLCLPPARFEAELMWERGGQKQRGDKLDLQRSKQFFARDPYVLRYYCYWDDRKSLHGDVRQLIMHYFLADDTIEVIEILPQNSGRDKFPCFLRKGKVPKQSEPMKRVGEVSKTSVLNVLGESGWSSRFLMDPKEVGKVYENNYLDCDIKIGSELNIYNKRVVVYDMDEFTKEYYRTKYGITDFTPGPCPPCATLLSFPCNKKPVDDVRPCQDPVLKIEGVGTGSCEPEVVETPPHCTRANRLEHAIEKYKEKFEKLPPHNGFGSEEDSVVNCLSLHPEQMVVKDFVKFMVHDRRALNSSILRFEARLITNFAPDKERKFILVYYRTDDTYEINELKINNSGFLGGSFCNRKKILKPGQDKFKSDLSEYYGPKDLYLDAVIVYSGSKFKLVGADEYALSYMEFHKGEFPQSDVQLVLRKLTPMVENKETKAKLDHCRDITCMTYDQFRCLIRDTMAEVSKEDSVNEHDFITMARHYKLDKKEEKDVECDLNVLRAELKRFNFEEFEDICYTCKHFDPTNSGKLSRKDMITIMKAHRVPVPIYRFEVVFDQLADENCMLDYCDILNRINWKENATIPQYYTTPIEDLKDKQKCREELFVNFKCIFDELIKIIYPKYCPTC